MTEAAKTLVRRFYDEISAGNLAVIDEVIADDFVEHEESSRQLGAIPEQARS